MLSYLAKIKEAVESRPAELTKAREKGIKVVGYFCSYIPEEIIHALGLIPVRLEYGGDERLVDIGGRYISKNNCVFVREAVGMFAEKKDPFVRNSDMVAVATTCLQMYRLSELLNHFFGVRCLILKVPRSFYLPEGQEYFQKEMEYFSSQLEEYAGKKLDMANLRKSIELYRDIRQTQGEIYKFQAKDPAIIGWKDVFQVIQAGFLLDREYYLSLLNGLLDELVTQGNGDGCNNIDSLEEKPRILLAGSIIARGDNKLINMIERMGGRIVADDLCTGQRFFAGLEVRDYSLEGLANAYLDKVPCASLPYLMSLETDKRLANLSNLIDDYRVEGIIYHTLRFCDPFTFKANETKQFFKDRVAFLEIHTEYATSDEGAIMTRVEAFMELIHNLRLGKKALAR